MHYAAETTRPVAKGGIRTQSINSEFYSLVCIPSALT